MTLETVARQAPLSVGFSRQEYWSGLPCPVPGDLSDSGIKATSLAPPALAGGFFTTSVTWEALENITLSEISQTQRTKAIRYHLEDVPGGVRVTERGQKGGYRSLGRRKGWGVFDRLRVSVGKMKKFWR